MKRLIPAITLALLIHMLFIYLEFSWKKKSLVVRPKIASVAMTLVQVKKEPPKPVLRKSPPPPPKVKATRKKDPPKIKKPAKKEKPIVKPAIKPKPKKQQVPVKKTVSSEVEPAPEPVDTKPAPPEMFYVEPVPETTVPSNEIKKTIIKTAIPLYKLNPRPAYPRLARRRGYQGTVVLDVLVDKNGRVSDLKLGTTSGYPILDKKAITSVKKWIFEPGKKGTNSVKMWVKVPIRFELK